MELFMDHHNKNKFKRQICTRFCYGSIIYLRLTKKARDIYNLRKEYDGG